MYVSQQKEDKIIAKLSVISEQLKESNVLNSHVVTYLNEVNTKLDVLNIKLLEMVDKQLSSSDINSSLEATTQVIMDAHNEKHREILKVITQLYSVKYSNY